MVDVYLYNSLTRKKEKFVPQDPQEVKMYTCGMTVYDYAHIGHGRKYVGDDLLRRALDYNSFKVKHVQNVTDVGHLTSDADEGEDKLEKGAAKTGKTVWQVAEFFANQFYDSMDKLNVLRPHIICKATEHIPDQIKLITKLFEKGFAYDTPEAVYYDISKFKNYTQLFGQSLEEKKTGVRPEVKKGEHKKHPADFALWFKRVGRFQDHTMHWDSPWGDGFPGWHIECSAMSMKYLGETLDIHTGGIDHLPVHHPNEIAQSEGATGKPFARYWVHHNFLKVEGRKMSKSLGNLYIVEDVIKKNIDPLALRYFYLTAHYRDSLNFTWEALKAADTALKKLKGQMLNFKNEKSRTTLSPEKDQKRSDLMEKFVSAINNDLNAPQALAVVWAVVKSNLPSEDKYDLLINFDEVLGLRLGQAPVVQTKIPPKVQELVDQREELRQRGQFEAADKIRQEIKDLGYTLEDTSQRTQVKPVD